VTSVAEALSVIGSSDADQASSGLPAPDPLLQEALRAHAMGGGK
jgi:hypothetical protein